MTRCLSVNSEALQDGFLAREEHEGERRREGREGKQTTLNPHGTSPQENPKHGIREDGSTPRRPRQGTVKAQGGATRQPRRASPAGEAKKGTKNNQREQGNPEGRERTPSQAKG